MHMSRKQGMTSSPFCPPPTFLLQEFDSSADRSSLTLGLGLMWGDLCLSLSLSVPQI